MPPRCDDGCLNQPLELPHAISRSKFRFAQVHLIAIFERAEQFHALNRAELQRAPVIRQRTSVRNARE